MADSEVADRLQEVVWAALKSAGVSDSLGGRASQLGHSETISRRASDNRFGIICSCGWKSGYRHPRRQTIREAQRHVFEVVYPPAPDPAKRVYPVTVTRISDGVSVRAGGRGRL